MLILINTSYIAGNVLLPKLERHINNEFQFGEKSSSSTSNIIGRKIDILMTIGDFELASCEWKAPEVSKDIAHEQETKNMRSNACICEKFASLPINSNSPTIIYLDVIGE